MVNQRQMLRLLGLALIGLLLGPGGFAIAQTVPPMIYPRALPPPVAQPIPLGQLASSPPALAEDDRKPEASSEAGFPPIPPLPGDGGGSAARPGRRPSTPVVIPTPPQRHAPRSLDAPPALSPVAPDSSDPADQVAPAVIELAPGNRAPSPVVFLAMQQELKNLIGRFESALLWSESLDAPAILAIPDRPPVLTAATDAVNLAGGAATPLPPALAEAQQLLTEWDALMAQGDGAAVQARWLQARTALWENFPAERPFAPAEIRAVWLDRGTIVEARSPQGLAQVFDRLAAAGFNTVFFETVNAGYPVYPSQVAPQQNPLTRSWDPLAAAVDLAHARGMTLHAWVWVFAVGNQRHNRLLNLPVDYPGPVLAAHPDWAGYDNAGNPIPRGQDKPFLDPANPEVRSYLTRLMTEIVADYPVDGLHLDYIRYPFQDPGANRTYGYGEVARWRFRSIAGVDPIDLNPRPRPESPDNEQIQQRVLWERWTEFRIHQVTSFVETLGQTLRRQRPELVLSAAVFANPDHERQQKIQQDWGTWARANFLDWIVLISYAQDTSRFEQLIQPWLGDERLGATLIIPGIRLLNLAAQAAIDQIQTTRDLPTPGYALFAAADLTPDFTTVLARTQGATDLTSPTPYQLAFERYQALRREWQWLLAQQKLWMDRDTLTPWVEAVNRLGDELQTLAEAPSRRELAAAQAGLAQVKAPLTNGILITSANSAYRLAAWQHHLTTVEQLLAYGERRS
ncbi:MAG: family 10 glycosylhydrolase [Nodosilinea sp.]